MQRTKRMTRKDLHTVPSAVAEILYDLRGRNTLGGHLCSIGMLLVTPIVIPVLWLWLPE